jgi:hypothetical protein
MNLQMSNHAQLPQYGNGTLPQAVRSRTIVGINGRHDTLL